MTTDNINREEYIESRSRSFLGLWPVAEKYTISDWNSKNTKGLNLKWQRYIVPVNNDELIDPRSLNRNTYMPMGRLELPGELAALSEGNETEIIEFANKHGLLGYHCALRFPFEEIGAHKSEYYIVGAPGDPVGWFIAHARAINLLLKLAEALDKPKDLKNIIETLSFDEPLIGKKSARYISYMVTERAFGLPTLCRMSNIAGSEKEIAMQIISNILNLNLTGLSRRLEYEYCEDQNAFNFNSMFEYNNLIDCIYWLIADAIIGERIRSCANCGKVIIVPNNKTKHCLPQPPSQISACMNQAKQKRFRNKKPSNDE